MRAGGATYPHIRVQFAGTNTNAARRLRMPPPTSELSNPFPPALLTRARAGGAISLGYLEREGRRKPQILGLWPPTKLARVHLGLTAVSHIRRLPAGYPRVRGGGNRTSRHSVPSLPLAPSRHSPTPGPRRLLSSSRRPLQVLTLLSAVALEKPQAS